MKKELENAETKFDELAKTLGHGLTRRESLRRIGGGLVGIVVGSLVGRAFAGGGNSDCAHFCQDTFPPGPDRGNCISQAAHGAGPCFECGPAAPPGHGQICGQVCCNANEICTDGQCVPLPGNTLLVCQCNDSNEEFVCANVTCQPGDVPARNAACDSACASHGGRSGGPFCHQFDPFCLS